MARRAIVLACLAALGAAGCGGEDSLDTPPERDAFVARMDSICRDANTRARAINSRAREAAARARGRRAQVQAIAPVLSDGVDLQRETLRRIGAVRPPEGDKRRFATILSYLDRQVALAGRLLAAARAGDVPRFQALLAEQARLRAGLLPTLRGFGFRECGRGA